jgi:mannan endo-1,4-beta-mannosidase
VADAESCSEPDEMGVSKRLANRFTRLTAIAAAIAGLAFAAPAAAQAPEGFVVADGDDFGIVGAGGVEPWRPVGYNQYRLTAAPGGYVCDGRYGEVSDAKLGVWLDQIRAAGATVVRTWFFQSQFDADGSGPGEGSFAAFDRVVQGAAARGMKVIPVLVNHWADCEFGGEAKTVEFYESGYREAGYGYQRSYLEYARTVASHYAGEPAIAFWQLVNEAEAPLPGGGCDEERGAAALRGFAAEMTAAIRSVDPNHLISLGTMGSGQCGTSDRNYKRVHEPVDIAEYHDYDAAGNPLDNPDNPIPGDQWNGLAARLEQAGPKGLNKPLFVGEAGIRADVAGPLDSASLQIRAEYFAAKIQRQLDAGVDGFLLWEKVLEPSDAPDVAGGHEAYGIGFGDPTEDVTRRFGQPWNGTAQPWSGEPPTATTPAPRKCKPKRGGRNGKQGKGRRCRR